MKKLWILLALVLVIATVLVPAPALAQGGDTVTVTARVLNVRSGPALSYGVIGAVQQGTTLPVLQRDAAGWVQVRLADGREGWVSAAYVRTGGAAAAAPATVRRSGQGTLVFQETSGGNIYAVNPNGTGLRRLTTGIDPAISPDGSQVAFTRWEGTANGVGGSLWLIGIDGTGERMLMTGARQPKSPTWSPDGTKIAISSQQSGRIEDTWFCPVNGVMMPVPVPTDDEKCFKQLADPYWILLIVDTATGTFTDLASDVHAKAPTWDPVNAWRIVYQGGKGLQQIDINRNANWLFKEGAVQRAPVFSPDGTKIATTFHQNDHWEIHLMGADGSGEIRLTSTPSDVLVERRRKGLNPASWNNAAPTWSPDGRQIVFLTDRNGKWELWIMNADGSGQRALLPATQLNIKYEGNSERVASWR